MANDVSTFLSADIAEQRLMAEDPAFADAVVTLLGADGLEQLRGLPKPDDGHLSAKPAPNTIFVPGVMGSVLGSSLGGVWWLNPLALNQLDRLALNFDGTDDGEAGIDIQPLNIDMSYTEFMTMGLSHDTVSIRGCAYDWRRRFEDNVVRVVDAIDDARAQNGNQPVNLVGHSMGGLLIRTAMMEVPELWDKVDKIVYIATPHFGSASIAGYLKGHLWGTEAIAALGAFISRFAFQSLYGPLSLLPAPAGIYPDSSAAAPADHPCANFDLYDVDAYELDLDAGSGQRDRLQARLDYVADFWERLTDHHMSLNNDQIERQFMIAGVGHECLFRLERDGMWFGLKDKKHRSRVPGDPHRDGDGRVPVASAVLPGVSTRYVGGEHGGLQNLPHVAAAAFGIAAGDLEPFDRLATSPEGALASHLGADASMTAPALSSTSESGVFAYETLFDELGEGERDALMAKAAVTPGFHLTKIL